MLRATMSIFAPASAAAMSSSMMPGSVSAFTFSLISARLPSAAATRDLPDQRDDPRAQRGRRDEQLAELLRPAEAGEVVEEVGDVGGDVLVGREDADVLVEARRDRVVVAGADVDVAAQPVALAADDERRLRVDLQVGEAVDDVDAGLLERAALLDVAALVEARLQLDEAHALLARLGGADERRDDGRLLARPVHGRLQRAHGGVGGGGADEALDASSRTTRTDGGRRRRRGGSPRTARRCRARRAAGPA